MIKLPYYFHSKWKRSQILRKVFNWIVLILSIGISIFLYSERGQLYLCSVQSLAEVSFALAGVLATVIALILSLAIIPFQKAVEIFTPSIIENYLKDWTTQWTLVCLAAFTLLISVCGITNGFDYPRFWLPIYVIMIGASIDLIRFYHRHIAGLMIPSGAVTYLRSNFKRNIKYIQKRIKREAYHNWKLFNDEQRNRTNPLQVEAALYRAARDKFYEPLRVIQELGEVCERSLDRGDSTLTNVCFGTIKELITFYIESRKGNITITLDGMYIDGDQIISTTLEILEDAHRKVVSKQNENAARQIYMVMGEICKQHLMLTSDIQTRHSNGLVRLPLAYLSKAIKDIQRASLYDAALSGCHILLEVANTTPTTLNNMNCIDPIIEDLSEIGNNFLLIPDQTALAKVPFENIATLANILSNRKYTYLKEVLSNIFKQYSHTMMLVKVLEGRNRFLFPVTTYLPLLSATDTRGLPYLLSKRVFVSQEGNRVDQETLPFILDVEEKLYRFLRDIAETHDLGSSFIVFELNQMLEQILTLNFELLDSAEVDDTHKQGIRKITPWLLSFIWAVFKNSKKINDTYSRAAAEIATKFGLMAYQRHEMDIVESCMGIICSVADSIAEKNTSDSSWTYSVADVFTFLEYFSLVAEKANDQRLKTKLKELESQHGHPRIFNKIKEEPLKHAVELRKSQFHEELEERDPHPVYSIGAIMILREILATFETRSEES